jgi:hypothetical protein
LTFARRKARSSANTRDIDKTRAWRALIAWTDGDKLALDVVLAEAIEDPVGAPGLLFELLDFGIGIGLELDPNLRDHLRETLLTFETPE